MLAALQERTQYRPTTDSALMKWIVRHAAWLIHRFRGNDAQTPFYRAVRGPYRGKLLEFGESVQVFSPFLRWSQMVLTHVKWPNVVLYDGCWRPLCPYWHSGRGRAAMWARVWFTLAAVETERLAPQGVEEPATKQETVEGMGEMPEIIVVSDAVDASPIGEPSATADRRAD